MMEAMTRTPEYNEGPESWTRFNAAMKHVMTVSKDDLNRRIEAERKVSEANPNKRGPKRKAKPSA